MAKSETTVVTIERDGCRVVRIVRNGSAGEWSVAARQAHAARPEPPEAGADPAQSAAAAADAMRTAFARAAAVSGGAAVLGLPTSRLLIRILRLPAAARDDLESAVALQMAKVAPFSGDNMTVAGEIVFADEETLTVLAAALPHAMVEELDAWVRAARVRIERCDALLLGWWQAARAQVAAGGPPVRRVFLSCAAGEWDLLIADGERPVLARGLGAVADPNALAVELTLSLLNAEIEAGASPLGEAIVFADDPPDGAIGEAVSRSLGVPLRHERPQQPDADLHGLALRDAGAPPPPFNLLPDLWRARNAVCDSKRRFLTVATGLAALWLALAGALFGMPAAMRHRVRSVSEEIRATEALFQQVSNVRTRADLIESYTDRSASALEAMRVVAERMPVGVELTMLVYTKEGVRLTGEAAEQPLAYAFKDAIENNPPFATCALSGVSLIPSQRNYRFEIQAAFKQEEGGK